MATKLVPRATELRGDEEAFLWATASLEEARRDGKRRSAALLEAVLEELAFGLGAAGFPPPGARTTRVLAGQDARAQRP